MDSGVDVTVPASDVVRAFGGDLDRLDKLPGGQGGSWRAGTVVLKPAAEDTPERIGWVAAILEQVHDTSEFRLARPVQAEDGRWIVDGWAATRWVEGEHHTGRWDERLAVSSALHRELARVPAEPADFARPDPWTVGMQVAWGRLAFDPERYPDVVSTYEEFKSLLEQPWTGPAAQVIHGDLCGNIVFADGLSPAVIDFSPHYAPALFADAIIIADGIAWENAPLELASRYIEENPAGASLLARAVLYRVVCAAHGWAAAAERVKGELSGYRNVLDIVRPMA